MNIWVGRGGELVKEWKELVPVVDGVGGVDVVSGVTFVVVGGGEPSVVGFRSF